MKFAFAILSTIIFYSCHQKNSNTQFILDQNFQDTVKQHVKFVSDLNESRFKTPITVRYFLNDLLFDSIVEPDFDMDSWYFNNNDTINLIAHIGNFETSALLLRFIAGKPNVFYLRAPHLNQKYSEKVKRTLLPI